MMRKNTLEALSIDSNIAEANLFGSAHAAGANEADMNDPVNLDILEKWGAASGNFIASIDILCRNLPGLAKLVEQSAEDLSLKFCKLAADAREQGERVQHVVEVTGSLEVGGEKVPLGESLKLIEKTVQDATDKILYVSKTSMSMVYSLDGAISQLNDVGSFIGRIQKITKQTNLLSLNATIEASRAGEAGNGFRVVADEVKNLSKEIAKLSEEMQLKIGDAVASVKDGYQILEQVATIDMSDNIMVKQKIDRLMENMLVQSCKAKEILDKAAESAEETTRNISSMIMGIQFQDKTSQYIGDFATLMESINQSLQTMRGATLAHLQHPTNTLLDRGAAKDLLTLITLTDLKHQFVQYLLEHGYISQPSDIGAGPLLSTHGNNSRQEEDIELF